jgi:hypothetical protein
MGYAGRFSWVETRRFRFARNVMPGTARARITEDFRETLPLYRDLGHLEGHVSAPARAATYGLGT